MPENSPLATNHSSLPLKKVVIFVHGILARDRGAKFGRLAPYFEELGYHTDIFSWGFGFILRPLFGTWLQARRVASLAERYRERGYDVVGVGHSHGAAILARASREYEAPFRVLAFLNAALDRDASIGDQVNFVLSHHAPGDPVLPLTHFSPVRAWGTLGKRGWKISAMDRDARLWQFNVGELGVSGHTGAFEPSKMELVGPQLANAVERFRALAAGEIEEL
jgi:alpha-beta hydrolase superfamily lysophospholipase